MANDQRTYETAGDLKRELQGIPDDAKISFGDGSKQGVQMQRTANGVTFGHSSLQQQQQRA